MDGSVTGPNTTKQLIIFSGFLHTYEKRCKIFGDFPDVV